MDSAKLRVEGKKMVHTVVKYWDGIRSRKPLSDVKPGYLRNLMPLRPPKHKDSWERIYSNLEKVVFNGSSHWNHPHFFAYFSAGIGYHSILADIISGGLGSIGFTWISCPSITELEKIMLDWLVELMGLPENFKNSHPGPGCGIIQSTASEATFIAIMTARAAKVEYIRNHPSTFEWIVDQISKLYRKKFYWRPSKSSRNDSTDIIAPFYHDASVFRKFVMYFCDQAHCSVEKGAMLAGVRYRKLKGTKKYLDNYGLDSEVFMNAIKEDRARGYIPFMLIATVGTTSTCGVDEIDKLGPICQKEQIYLHVDAAYAGSFAFCEEYKYLVRGIEYADSYNTNLHKAGLINFDCSPLWFKNGTYAARYYNVDPVYLMHKYQSTGTDYRHLEVPLGRRFRSLKVWLTIRNMGVGKIKEYQRKTVNLALLFSKVILENGKFELFTPPHLGLVTFRLKNQSNSDNERLLRAINKDRRIYLVPTVVHGVYLLRFCVGSPLTNEEDIKFAKKVIFEIAQKMS